MDHFNVPEQWRMQVEHAALKKARDAWRNWKHVLYKKYLSEGKDPIPAYPQITKADWAEFKRVRATKEFAEKSVKQSELQKKNTHTCCMGVAGYYGMKPIWDQEDKEAVAAGGKPAFSEIRATALETTCGHMQGGVTTVLITLKTHMMKTCIS